MATSSSSSSLLLLFIDTDLHTHFSFTIDGHQSVAQLKGRIVSEHANCFPGFGEISAMAVKAKIGEFFYHLSDSMILNWFFQSVEGAKRFQVDIVRVSSTSKSSDQVKTNTNAPMHNGQASIKESSQPNTVQHVGSSLQAKVDDKHYNSNYDGSGSNMHNTEKADFGCRAKDNSNVDLDNTKKSPVEHGDSSMSKVGDTSQKIQIKMDIDVHMEKKLPETDEVGNRNRIHGAPVQLDTNTIAKDSTDLKHKKKKSRNKELYANPLVEDSLHKINDTRADNQPKESIVKETISNSNEFGNESGIAASIKESSQPTTVQHVELLLQANVDDKHKGKGKVIEVSSPAKPLNNTSCDLDSGMHETDVSSTGLLNCHKTTTDKMLTHEHIEENSTGNDPPAQFSNHPASQIPKDRFILGLAISSKETTSEATGNHEAENIATLDNNIKEIAPTQKRRQKRVVRKIRNSRFGNQSMKSNEDELAPTFMQSEKNDGSGSNTHETEKAKSGSHAKDDSNVSLDNTETLPGKRRKRLVFN